MLGPKGPLANSAPYRRLRQALAVIPLWSSAPRRLPRGPESKAKAGDGSLLRNIAQAKRAPAVAGDGASSWLRIAQCFGRSHPLRGAEKRRAPGVWKWPTVRSAYRALSSATSPGDRASQGTPQGRRTQGVLSFGSFSLHKQRKGTPAEGDPTLIHNENLQSTQARQVKQATAKSPLSLTLSHEGRGDSSRELREHTPCT